MVTKTLQEFYTHESPPKRELRDVIDAIKVKIQGGAGSGNFGHAGRPGKVGGSSPRGVYVGKNKYSKRLRGKRLEPFGLPYDEGKKTEIEDAMKSYFEDQRKAQREADERYRRWTKTGEFPEVANSVNPLEDYKAIDHTKSHTLDPSAGFPENHPFADPKTRVNAVNTAVSELSYSNIVGLGAALRETARGNKDNELYKHFSRQLPSGATMEDLLVAVYQETQGMISQSGITGDLLLFHGTSNKPKTTQEYSFFDFDNIFTGFSSWSGSEYQASQFGNYTVEADIPLERLMVVPSLIPKQLAGVPSFLGGGRDEGEYIVLSKDGYDLISSRIDYLSNPPKGNALDIAKEIRESIRVDDLF